MVRQSLAYFGSYRTVSLHCLFAPFTLEFFCKSCLHIVAVSSALKDLIDWFAFILICWGTIFILLIDVFFCLLGNKLSNLSHEPRIFSMHYGLGLLAILIYFRLPEQAHCLFDDSFVISCNLICIGWNHFTFGVHLSMVWLFFLLNLILMLVCDSGLFPFNDFGF